ncbi:hypothetical protein T265_03143 [Opisthorchis viverrini]|uniref:Uncharacterized protein n=1 Tax=Opisthorchis viverrini TaxID=6198 RepID=A0A074ZSK7_OPIVI|nr:hypothetical protein T265_03143 [Opisthorchis viverrini]KER30408.1 hypothetical protein T265_03143 [Opisthorchis viverrini]
MSTLNSFCRIILLPENKQVDQAEENQWLRKPYVSINWKPERSKSIDFRQSKDRSGQLPGAEFECGSHQCKIGTENSAGLDSRFGQPDSIPALVLPSGGMAVRHQKGATAEQFYIQVL